MALKIAIEDPSTGAAVTYHRITALTIDLISCITIAVVRGYISEAARRTGKNHLTLDQVQISGVPPAGEDALAWAYTQMATKPTEHTSPADPSASMTPVASAWAGAEVA